MPFPRNEAEHHKAAINVVSAPVIAKAARLEKKAANIRPRRQKLPGSKDSGWKAKIGGGWVRRDQQ